MSDFRSIWSNAAWNAVGNAAPLVAAAVAVPFLVTRLGVERFGLLSLVWLLIGYFSVFDLGLGRAITQRVARNPDAADASVRAACATGVALATALGVVGGLIVALAAWAGAGRLAGADAAHALEFGHTLWLVALGTPVVVVTSAYRGILEGFSRFRLLNAIRVPAGVLLFAVPCAVALWEPDLPAVTAALAITRVAILGVHVMACRGLVRFGRADLHAAAAQALVRFGGWLTVSNLVGPVIVYVDRFVVGALLSATMLAYYAAPFEVVTRLLVFPAALTSALFPALAQAFSTDDRLGTELQRKATRLTLALTLPVMLLGILLAAPVLRLWLGPAFEQHGAMPMRLLLVGFVFNALAQIPLTALYGRGRTRPVALLHLTELPCYLALLYLATVTWGLPGAAAAWMLRNAADYAALRWLSRRPMAALPSEQPA